jgi:hypothetical protein
MIGDDRVELAWELSSGWSWLADSPHQIECLTASVSRFPLGRDYQLAETLGAVLATGLTRRRPAPDLWLFVANPRSFNIGSRVGAYMFKKLTVFDELRDAGSLARRQLAAEFEVVYDGDWRGRGAALRLGAADWGQALRVMLQTTAVGVAFAAAPTAEELCVIGGTLLQAKPSRGPVLTASYRMAVLRCLFVENPGSVVGALTLFGEFDDPELQAEYHEIVQPGQLETGLRRLATTS